MRSSWKIVGIFILGLVSVAWGHYPPGEFLFAVQFPDENLPTVDGNIAEWSVIPQVPYEVGNDMYSDAVYSKVRGEIDVSDLSVRQIVGWNDNNNRLYLMAEVFDNVHNADREDPAQFWSDDSWEIYIAPTHPEEDGGGAYAAGAGGIVMQSFNFAMPPIGGNWGQNLPDFEWRVDPFNNDTWQLEFSFEGEEFGESTYFYEMWIQPLDFIPEDGDREAAEETDLEEGQIIAMSWTFGDFDAPGTDYQGFWSTSPNGCCRADNDVVLSEIDYSIWSTTNANPSASVDIGLPDTAATPGAVLTLPVDVSQAAGIAGVELVVSYDPNVLTPTQVQRTSLTAGFQLADSTQNGKIAISLASGTAISNGSGSLVQITFKVNDTAVPGATTDLGLRNVAIYDRSRDPIPVVSQDGKFTVISPEPTGILGDVNADDIVDVRDAILCLMIVAGNHTPTAYEQWATDVNADTYVRVDDALLILNKTVERLLALKPVWTSIQRAGKARVRVGEPMLIGDQCMMVPLQVEKGEDICALELTLSYPSEAWEILTVRPGKTGGLMETNTTEEGKVRVGLINREGIMAEDGTMIALELRPRGDVSHMALALEEVYLFDGTAQPIEVSVTEGIGETSHPMALPVSRLSQNYPNPFNAQTTIEYYASQNGLVSLRIYNVEGQLIKELVAGMREEGNHVVFWDGTDEQGRSVSSGVYLYRLDLEGGSRSGSHSEIRKLVLLQ